MAELVLKIGTVGPDPALQDGDILCALNDDAIGYLYSQKICFPERQFDRDQLWVDTLEGLAEIWYENTCRYKFTRVSRNEVERFNKATTTTDTINATPSMTSLGQMEHIRVDEFVTRRKKSIRRTGNGLPFFGTNGREVWYGHEEALTPSRSTSLWSAIEAASGKARADAAYRFWPLTGIELRHYLTLDVTDFSVRTAQEYVSSVNALVPDPDGGDPEPTGDLLKKRSRRVIWRDVPLTSSEAQIEARGVPVDERSDRTHSDTGIVEVKP